MGNGRMTVLAMLALLGLTACQSEPPAAAQRVCASVTASRAQVDAIVDRTEPGDDFDRVSVALMDLAEVTAPLQDWADVPAAGEWDTLRKAARGALAATGYYPDGSNPVTGSELQANLAEAQPAWDRLETTCATALP